MRWSTSDEPCEPPPGLWTRFQQWRTLVALAVALVREKEPTPSLLSLLPTTVAALGFSRSDPYSWVWKRAFLAAEDRNNDGWPTVRRSAQRARQPPRLSRSACSSSRSAATSDLRAVSSDRRSSTGSSEDRYVARGGCVTSASAPATDSSPPPSTRQVAHRSSFWPGRRPTLPTSGSSRAAAGPVRAQSRRALRSETSARSGCAIHRPSAAPATRAPRGSPADARRDRAPRRARAGSGRRSGRERAGRRGRAAGLSARRPRPAPCARRTRQPAPGSRSGCTRPGGSSW